MPISSVIETVFPYNKKVNIKVNTGIKLSKIFVSREPITWTEMIQKLSAIPIPIIPDIIK